MTEETIKRRLFRAKRREKNRRKGTGAKIINSDNEVYCFTADYTTHEDKIRVTWEKIAKEDIKMMQRLNAHPNQSKQIACYKLGEKERILIEVILDSKIKILCHPQYPNLEHEIISVQNFFEIS